jgi:hypothetical protein
MLRKKHSMHFFKKIYNACPRHNIKIVLGDMNAQIGKEDIYYPTIGKHCLHNHSNGIGLRLINFAISRGMSIANTHISTQRHI